MAAARVTHALCISVNLPAWPNVHALARAYEAEARHLDGERADKRSTNRNIY